MSILASSPTVLASINPATGDIVGQVRITPVAGIPEIVARARAATSAWSTLSFAERAKPLIATGRTLVDEAESLGSLLTQEMGKPLKEAVGEVRHCGTSMEKTCAEIATALEPDVYEEEGVRSVVHFDPLGVCAAITPWNFPIAMPHESVVPALMAGNTVVLKPSEETPLIAQAYVDALNEHLPEGVLQIVHGADEQGRALCQRRRRPDRLHRLARRGQAHPVARRATR